MFLDTEAGRDGSQAALRVDFFGLDNGFTGFWNSLNGRGDYPEFALDLAQWDYLRFLAFTAEKLADSGWKEWLLIDNSPGEAEADLLRSLPRARVLPRELALPCYEKAVKYEHGLIPGPWWGPDMHHFPGINPSDLQMFFVLYFIMTSMHALHMVIGFGVLAWLFVLSAMKRFGENRYLPIEFFGFYWHFVDIVWVFLFPLFYLVR